VPPRKASGSKRGRSARGARRGDLLGRRIGAEATSPCPTCLAVYDGRTCIGSLMPRGKSGVEAFDSADRSLGLFVRAVA
jgi:hypothetical protein